MSDAFIEMFSNRLDEEERQARGLAQKMGMTDARPNEANEAEVADAGVDAVGAGLPLINRKPPQYVRQQELPWHRVALERAALGYTAREIAEQLGCSPTAVQDILRQPAYQRLQTAMIEKQLTQDQKVVDKIREKVTVAVDTLAEIVEDKKAKNADRINAARELLNRRYGMPNQPINRNTDVDLNKLSDRELAAMLIGTN